MSNLTKTLKTQTVRSFGPSPSTQWNLFQWTASGVGPGNGCWGMKSAACQGTAPILKGLFRTLSHSSMSVGISCPASSIFRNQNKVHVHTCTVSYANSNKDLTDGSGFHYLYPGGVTNQEDEFIPSFTSGALASTTYSQVTGASTVWT